MTSVKDKLDREYDRWIVKFGASLPEDVPGTLPLPEVLRAHYLLCEYFIREGEVIGMAGPRDEHLLPSAVGRQFAEYGGIRKYTDPLDLAATLFYGLVKNHAFYDGNKRTAFLSAVYQLQLSNRVVDSKHRLWEDLAVSTAEGRLSDYPQYRKVRNHEDPEVAFISDFFRRNTRRTDKSYYVVTFAQLKSILQEFGFDLDEPGNNFIHVIKCEKVMKGPLFNRKPIEVRRAILKIGFPSWSTEVSRKDIQRVRQATGLVPENDCDSMVFFKGADQLETLIPKYHRVLRRLRDK